MDRTALARKALVAALQVRRDARDPQGPRVKSSDPVCPFDVAARVGVRVQFMRMSAEGLYSPHPEVPAAFVNAERPGPRQRYTCAHELGHHAFGHGLTLDEVVGRRPFDDPAEFVADVFAGHLLMPELGVLRAFRTLGADPAAPDPFATYTVASEFGVGYRTLLTHLAYTTRTLTRERADALARYTPKRIRAGLAPGHPARELTVVMADGRKPSYDVVAGGLVLVRGDVETSGPGLEVEGVTVHGPVVRARAPGGWPLRVGDREGAIRVTPPAYAGRAEYRHVENDEWALAEVER